MLTHQNINKTFKHRGNNVDDDSNIELSSSCPTEIITGNFNKYH